MSTTADCPDSNNTLIRQILSRFHSFEIGIKDQAIVELKLMDRQYVMSALRKLIENQDPDLRCDALEALLVIDKAINLDVIVQLLEDPFESVRWNTCGLLHDYGTNAVVPNLVRVLVYDPEGSVRG
jgi:HEAT repeat protein